jgi:hypothetical protein
MMKAKFIAGRIPWHLLDIFREGSLYSVIDQNDTVLVIVDGYMVPFRREQVERKGEQKSSALLQIRPQDEFLDQLLKDFERDEDDIDLVPPEA